MQHSHNQTLPLALTLVLHLWSVSTSAECAPEVTISSPDSGKALLQALPDPVAAQLLSEGSAMQGSGRRGAADCNGMSQILVIFDKPRARVLELLTQTHRQSEFIPTLASVRSVERSIGESVDEHMLRVLFTRLTYRVHNRWSKVEWRIYWELDPNFDNDIRELRGYWHFYELDPTRTLAVYASDVDIGPPIPKNIQRALTRRIVRQTVQHFRRWVDSDGTYVP